MKNKIIMNGEIVFLEIMNWIVLIGSPIRAQIFFVSKRDENKRG